MCRLNATTAGNMVDEVTGAELSADNWGVDRVINGTVPGVSGEYRNSPLTSSLFINALMTEKNLV